MSHQPQRIGLLGDAASATLTDLDWRLIRGVHQFKCDLPSRPKQTGFRVMSIVTYRPAATPTSTQTAAAAASSSSTPLSTPHPYDSHMYIEGTDHKLAFVTGTNTEPCFIGNSICSERSALYQLRMKHVEKIEKLYLTADASDIITPGLLCREMMCEFLSPSTPIIMAAVNDKFPGGFEVQIATLAELYPYPSIYLNVPGSTVVEYGQTFQQTKAHSFEKEFAEKKDYCELYTKVKETTAKDLRPTLHPLRYASGVLFSDGSVRTVAMTKLLEYGWSLDAIVKLVPYLEERRANEKAEPVLILLSDQFGNLHAPSAPARAHLSEYNYNPLLVFHETNGQLVQTRPKALAPDTPDAISDVLPGTVKESKAASQ